VKWQNFESRDSGSCNRENRAGRLPDCRLGGKKEWRLW
jgi:hypothetical protein